MRYLTLLLGAVLISCSSEKHPLTLSPLFSDHMVVQQKEPVIIWGTSLADVKVTAEGSWGARSETLTQNDSTWKLELEPPSAGGPYELTIFTKDTSITVADVYSGEVWLASGQSNMEWPLSATNDAEAEIASADLPTIRMFTVPRAMSFSPGKDLNGSWKECSPENAGAFSAVGYFFAKKLQKTLNIPVGIIHTSWGGTPAEAWTSDATLRKLKDFDKQLDQVAKAARESSGYSSWLGKLQKIPLDNVNIHDADLSDQELADPGYNDSSWKTMELPTLWEEPIGSFDGVVWFRKEISLDSAPDGAYTLSLGPIDDMDITYVNGIEVGRIVRPSEWQTERNYNIPEGVLKAGKNVVAVKVMDNQGGGGIYGSPDLLLLKGQDISIPLTGEWKYLPVAEYLNNALYALGVDNKNFSDRPASLNLMTPNTPSILYNAMIAPVIDYSFKGAIWYQGEANVGRAKQYMTLFPAMIEDWREKAENNFPFYYVQIAPFEYNPGGTTSADLRESQRRTMDVAENTGMVVTLDIGNVKDIHPRNKKDVGERLALWTLNKDYGQEMIFSGPIYQSHEAGGNKLRIRFKYAESGLTFGSEQPDGFEIAGEDGRYYTANAEIEGSELLLSAPQVSKPVNVRYAWSDISEATLFNKEGLPASTFSTGW